MDRQAQNPILPLHEFIADGEPHVFGDRVYLFGSHDEAGADTYCAKGYEFYSAPVGDLSDWTSKETNYTADRDPLSEKTGRHYLYAPDVVRGNDGRYYLYYCLSGEKGKGPARRILPVHDRMSGFSTGISLIPRDGHFLTGHGFFEGSSIRKINGLYYFIYSSMYNHELCYAVSRYPDRDFVYGGVIISNGDISFHGRKEKKRGNYTATNHGSVELINGNWYVFYHRQTHGTDYSRQACAEKIRIKLLSVKRERKGQILG